MNEERLEEIKTNQTLKMLSTHDLGIAREKGITLNLDDYDWLIERVQELEESIIEATDFMLKANENESLIKARIVLNAALEGDKQ